MRKGVDEQTGREADLRSYGRRRGRKRSARQNEIFNSGLSQWGITVNDAQPIDLAAEFSNEIAHFCLEIGFGGAEHLIWQAGAAPDHGFIGAEPFEDGVVKALRAIQQNALTNVRIWPGDTRVLMRALSDASFAKVFMLFPDPWPKARHAKRRLFSKALLDSLARIMKPDAELRVATDSADYACAILRTVKQHPAFTWPVVRPDDWRQRPTDWPATRYEQKARCAKRHAMFFRFQHQQTGKNRFTAENSLQIPAR